MNGGQPGVKQPILLPGAKGGRAGNVVNGPWNKWGNLLQGETDYAAKAIE
jgi:hypothetical protein